MITSPKLSKLDIKLEGDAKAVIRAHNLYEHDTDSSEESSIYPLRNIYISSVELNGERINRNWFTHDELFADDGGRLEFTMTDEPTNWDEDGEFPPSRGHFRRDDIRPPIELETK